MELARINGAEIEYEDAGTGEPVIFLHGVLLGDSFRSVLAAPLVVNGYRTITYHRRGYAGSKPGPAADSIAEAAADCRALLTYLDVERAHVVGHSYGGVAALQLTLDAPDMVHSLALLEAALLVGPNEQTYRDALTRTIERFREEDAEAVVDHFLGERWPGYRAVLDRALPGAFEQAVADASTVFQRELPGLLGWSFSEAEARRINHPVLSILGGDSDAIGRRFGDAHRMLLASLPNAEEVVLPGTTHIMQLQDPQATAAVLTDFWARRQMAV